MQQNSLIIFNSLNLISSSFKNSGFLSCSKCFIVFNKSLIDGNIFISNDTNEKYLIYGEESNFLLESLSLQHNDFISFGFFSMFSGNETKSGFFLLKSSRFHYNKEEGNSVHMFEIFGHFMVYIKNDSFLRNSFNSLIFIKNSHDLILLNNNIFQKNNANSLIYFKIIKLLLIDSLNFVKNEKRVGGMTPSLCLFLHEFSNLKVKNVEIKDNLVLNGVTGIVIIQTRFIFSDEVLKKSTYL